MLYHRFVAAAAANQEFDFTFFSVFKVFKFQASHGGIQRASNTLSAQLPKWNALDAHTYAIITSLKKYPGITSDLAGCPLCATEAPLPPHLFIFSPHLPRETKPILSAGFRKNGFCNPYCRKHVNSAFRLRYMPYIYAHYITCEDHRSVL